MSMLSVRWCNQTVVEKIYAHVWFSAWLIDGYRNAYRELRPSSAGARFVSYGLDYLEALLDVRRVCRCCLFWYEIIIKNNNNNLAYVASVCQKDFRDAGAQSQSCCRFKATRPKSLPEIPFIIWTGNTFGEQLLKMWVVKEFQTAGAVQQKAPSVKRFLLKAV